MFRGFVLLMLGLTLAAMADAVEVRYGVTVSRDVVYGMGLSAAQDSGVKPLLMDMYLPEDCPDMLKPAVVIVHGGQFRFLDKTQQPHTVLSRFFAARGFAAFCIDYRQVQDLPQAEQLPERCATRLAQQAAVADCRAAIRWVRANASLYGIDPEMVAGVGSSAGGTCMYGLAFEDAEPGPGNDPLYELNSPGYSSRLQACVALWGNPSAYFPDIDQNDTPILFAHGLFDPKRDTPPGPVLRLQEVMNVAGAPYEFLPLDMPGHALWEARVDNVPLGQIILDFLARELGL